MEFFSISNFFKKNLAFFFFFFVEENKLIILNMTHENNFRGIRERPKK